MMSSRTGNEGCKCTNQTSVLASLTDRVCTTPSGEPGVYLTLGGSCVPYDYGSNSCLQHDILHDAKCQGDLINTVIEPYCFQPWCYVDPNTCKKESDEKIYKSNYFLDDNEIFYSYSTCEGINWFTQTLGPLSVAENISISSTIPMLQYPKMSKQLPNGTTVYKHDNTYYFDDSIPYGGIYIDYIDSIVELSRGDIQNVTFTHTSRSSLKEYPSSKFTAAVEDVKNGIVDMAVGPFWITGQRLKMTTFTVPLIYDKTVLVIQKPGEKSRLGYETHKVLEPFAYGLWAVVITVIIVASLLSVWFSDREMMARKKYGVRLSKRKKTLKEKWKEGKFIYLRLILDEILQKGIFFFSAGIEQDTGASLPHKVLMFGFGFFILIAVSAYVANLAAFLTRSNLKPDISTMRQVVENEKVICGHPALEEEFRLKWPKAKWHFPERGFTGPDNIFEAYDREDCQFLAVGREDTVMNRDIQAKMCQLDLVYTEDVITENPIAFPIRPQLAAAFSYWMYTGEKSHGITLDSAKKNFREENKINRKCETELSKMNIEEVDDFTRVTPSNMFLPIMSFVICALIAVILQLIHENKRKKGLLSSIGRKSSLNLYEGMSEESATNVKDDDDDEDFMRLRAKSSVRGQQLGDGGNDEDDQIIHEPLPTLGESTNNSSVASTEGQHEMSRRIEKLVESGVMEEVLDCFDFFQEVKKVKDK